MSGLLVAAATSGYRQPWPHTGTRELFTKGRIERASKPPKKQSAENREAATKLNLQTQGQMPTQECRCRNSTTASTTAECWVACWLATRIWVEFTGSSPYSGSNSSSLPHVNFAQPQETTESNYPKTQINHPLLPYAHGPPISEPIVGNYSA